VLHFVIPFFNNQSQLAENALALHAFLTRELPGGFELVLCDDGSTDGSRAEAQKLERSHPAIRVAGYETNRGRGYAVRFAALTSAGGQLIFSDLDLSRTTDLRHILDMKERLEDCRVVVGSRFLPGSATRRRRKRDLVGRTHRLFVRLFLPGLKVNDPDSGFKGFDLGWLQRMCGVSRMDRWSWDMEVLTIARANGLSIAEIAIDWNERHDAYVSSVKLVRDAWEELRGMIRIRRNLRKGRYRLSSIFRSFR
jgi:glycosyltransferase involved in cell wall biosynthesis